MSWKRFFMNKTKLEKLLMCFVVLLCCIVIALFVITLSSAHETGICTSEECVKAANHILDTIDPSVNPCDNFYEFACGSFLKTASLDSESTTLTKLQKIVYSKLKDIITEKTNEAKLSKALIMQRKFYRACINETAIENDGDKTFLRLIDEVVGGWPVLKPYSWENEKFNWDTSMVKARKLGLFYQFFLRIVITPAKDNNTRYIWIRPPYKTDVANFHWKLQNLDAMAEIAWKLGSPSIEIQKDLRHTMDFANNLEKAMAPYFTTQQKIHGFQKKAIKDIQHIFIKIDWFGFLKNITGIPLKETDEVIFDVEDYLREFYFLLLKFPKRIQANYIAWALISTNADYLTKKIRDQKNKILKFANYTTAELGRSKLCYKISRNLFKSVAEGEYVRRYMTPVKRKAVRNIIKNLKEELSTMMQQSQWLDKETKNNAIKLLNNITYSIGWHETVYNASHFEKLLGYEKFKLNTGSLLNMSRDVAFNGVNQYYNQVHNNILDDYQEFIKNPKLEINAYYLESFNNLILPAPILQGLIYDNKRPNYLNYGTLGSIIGHEIMHAFQVDTAIEDLKNNSWWTEQSIENFKKEAICVVDEYNKFVNRQNETNSQIDVLDENIADFSGVNLAYTAYQKWFRYHLLEEKLPSINYTPNQLFWIMSSTYLCKATDADKDEFFLKRATHAMASFRVVGRLRNSPYFAKDFNCPIGSKMNPKEKCRIFA